MHGFPIEDFVRELTYDRRMIRSGVSINPEPNLSLWFSLAKVTGMYKLVSDTGSLSLEPKRMYTLAAVRSLNFKARVKAQDHLRP